MTEWRLWIKSSKKKRVDDRTESKGTFIDLKDEH